MENISIRKATKKLN